LKFNQGTSAGQKKVPQSHKEHKGELNFETKLCVLSVFVGLKEIIEP
jgi:hypothetical protein